jgi:hypothetical protein
MVPMACSNWARATPTSTSWARTVSSWVRAWATSASVADSAGEAALGQIELALQVGDGGCQQLDLGIEAAQLEVVGGHFGVQAEVDVGHVRGAGLGALERAASTVRRMRPQKSGSQLACRRSKSL